MVLAELAELKMLTDIGQMLKEDLFPDPISGTVGSYRSQSLHLPLPSPLGSETLGLNPSNHSLGAMFAPTLLHIPPWPSGVVGSTPDQKSGGTGSSPGLGINLFQKVVGQMVEMGGMIVATTI